MRTIGIENTELIPQMEKWCTHLSVQGYARGMVAEMYRLPNNVKLQCQHAAFPSDWLKLSVIAEEFIAQNCLSCVHHQVRSTPNYGEAILNKLKKQKGERLEQEKLQADLVEKIKQESNALITSGKSTANPTQLSILKMLTGLGDESQRPTTATKLCAAAVLDPSFFNNDALSILAMHFKDEQAGSDCIDAACAVMAGRKYFPLHVLSLVEVQIGTSVHYDKLAKVLGLYIDADNIKDQMETISVLVTRLWYKRSVGESLRPERDFYNAEALLTKLIKIAPEEMKNIFKQHLAIDEKDARVNVNLLLQRLSTASPYFIAGLAPEIIHSLEFTDDEYEESADAITLETIQVLFCQDPTGMFKCLNTEKTKLSDAAKALLPRLTVNLLNDIAFADNNSEIAIALVDEMIADMLNGGVPNEIKTAARHQLSYFINERPELFQSRFDGFLGYLSKVAEEETTFRYYQEELEKKRPGEYTTFNYLVGMQFYEVRNIEQNIDNRYRETQTIIGELCKFAPQQNLPKVYSIIPEISSSRNEKYKNELINIVTSYGKDPGMLAGFIPQLYTYLLDPESINIRYTALKFLDKIIEKFPMLVTTSLWDLFNVFLEDDAPGIKGHALRILGTVAVKYPERITKTHIKIHNNSFSAKWVFVINSAVRISNTLRPFMDKSEQQETSIFLAQLVMAYSKSTEEERLSEAIDQLLLFITNQPEALYKISLNFISPRISKGDYYDVRKQLDKLWYLSKKTPSIAALWLDGALLFLTKFPYNGYGGQDDRLEVYFNMHRLKRQLIYEHVSKFLEVLYLSGTAMERHFEVAHILELLGYFELYAELQEITSKLEVQFPDVEANKWLRRNISFWQLIANGEMSINKSEKKEKLNTAANVFEKK
jgi:hypothetical protein